LWRGDVAEKEAQMKEGPILFSGPMVRAILEGRKTQTRRVLKIQPRSDHEILYADMDTPEWRCPYGEKGERLWVKETFAVMSKAAFEARRPAPYSLRYKADPDTSAILHFRPSIFMPRWASRITLEITDVRVQRLKEISKEDAYAEGIPTDTESIRRNNYNEIKAYREIWESINGTGSWDLNPWVWAITFKKL
jgi:hypothetical protein